jgi:pimeloyl-ACP methyl ester carboxylesterase
MAERWVVLGGWSLSPELLRPLFGDDAVMCDTNLLMPELIAGDRLRDDWRSRALRWLRPQLPQPPFGLAGWSTGSMIAWAVAPPLKPTSLAMLSATPSFCATPSFPHGTRPRVLERMRSALPHDPQAVLASFRERCGMDPGDTAPSYGTTTLTAGLSFLRHANLPPLEPPPFPVRFFHGAEDQIIPPKAGRSFAAMIEAPFSELSGGHAFFAEHGSILRDAFGG